MRRVVNYHSSWARQHQVEMFDASGIRCSVKASGSLPHFEHTPWPLIRCRSFGAMFEFLGSLVGCSLQLLSGNPGFTAGRGFNPAGGAPGASGWSLILVHVCCTVLKCHCFVSCCISVVSYQDARASGNTALSSPCWVLLATMRRVVNYHSSWARQQQVEMFDASGILV
ncbi:OSBP(oxysterol binding protein)-related protein 1D isoform 1 [Dorcoceras hygrometricum]|uniref:OSBP(Oxysterol binding protein)-related protein 1D isoform 1 n=1 Tax=Dorcoceras hygrometricum TaxID=472368 RepID=A0A2Z7C0T9_9LAMI|nr:OSBP(oxysterol binding protein)-related protein 1D isoform 1 [Dorcoceras hygrometricum]